MKTVILLLIVLSLIAAAAAVLTIFPDSPQAQAQGGGGGGSSETPFGGMRMFNINCTCDSPNQLLYIQDYASNQMLKLVYKPGTSKIYDHQNPTGATLPEAARRAILARARAVERGVEYGDHECSGAVIAGCRHLVL